MNYPAAPKTDLVDTLHGVRVPDPFRVLETADAPATAAWVDAENALTRSLLDSPDRDRLVTRLRALHRVPRQSLAAVRGDRIFFLENDGTRNQAVLFTAGLKACATSDSAGARNLSDVTQGLSEREQLTINAETAETAEKNPENSQRALRLPGRRSGTVNGAKAGALRSNVVCVHGLFSPASRQVLVDPNALDPDGMTAITVLEPDPAGERVVYGLSRHGSDVQDLHVHDVARGVALADRLQWVKFASIAWWQDGFFYTRYPQPGTVPAEHEQYFCEVWFHRLGEAQDRDRLVYHRPDAPEITFDVDVTADDRHLVITSHRGASDDAEIHVARLPAPRSAEGKPDATDEQFDEPRALVTGFTAGWHFIDGLDGQLYFRTEAGAPFGCVVGFDLSEPAPAPTGVVAESGDTLIDAAVADGRLLLSSLRNASSRLESWSLDGTDPREIALPGFGTIVGLAARWHDARSFATFTSFTMPPTIMACDEKAGRLTPIGRAALPFDPAEYLTEQVSYPSKDGTPISMFLTRKRTRDGGAEGPHCNSAGHDHSGGDDDGGARGNDCRAGLPPSREDSADRRRFSGGGPASDGQSNQRASASLAEAPKARRRPACPVLLTGYGGFNISLTPTFDASDFLWLDEGGVMAVANLRGGGEYGDGWHRGGMRERKQNVFDDFITGAEWLIATGRAGPGQVAIEGGSNGGLLVAACMLQRPDLFGAVVCRVPVADMLRYHLFTVGRFWIPEYGCADTAGDFAYLFRYSPYHNVADGVAYPPTLVMTADADDRVAPGMAKKFVARLQEAVYGSGAGPILLRVETRAGHGAGKPISKQIEEQADIYAFLFQSMHERQRASNWEADAKDVKH